MDDPGLLAEVRALIAGHVGASSESQTTPEEEQLDETVTFDGLGDGADVTEKGSERIGPYKLLQQIGEGGFGTVWMAEQSEPISRRVALKIIKLGMDTKEVIARFGAERQALAMMDHPNIARVLDAGATDNGRPFFVMELVKGMPITKYCDEAGLDTRQRLELFRDVCAAIQHAHHKGIIHRDIKPSNVLVTLYADKPVVKVIDFGIAKATQGKLTEETLFTRFEQIIGTPAYMSPEQADLSAVDIDTRSDIYALGILLYELLTGKPPFDAKTLMSAGYDEMRRVIREVEPPKPSQRLGTLAKEERTTLAKARKIGTDELGGLVEADLDWIVMKAIDKDRSRRYETASAFAADIARHLQNEVIAARPPNASYLLGKLIRRHKFAFATGSAIVTSLILGITVSVWQAVRATRAENQATTEADRATAAERQAREETVRAIAAERKTADAMVAVAAERDAKENARADAEAISTFLTQLLQSPDPKRDGYTITVAEILGPAAKKLESALADQPARRVLLQATLGQTYHSLGLYREAIPLKESVRDYHVAESGPEHPDTLAAMHSLATTYHSADRSDDAIRIQEEVLALRRKIQGPEHALTISTMRSVANSYHTAGRREEALKLQEEVLELRRQQDGPEHPRTLSAMHSLAGLYHSNGRLEESLKMREEVLALRRKVLGPEHARTIATLGSLASSYAHSERRGEAVKLLEEVLAIHRKRLGPEHPTTITSVSRLAKSYSDAGREDEALKLREEVVALSRKVLGPEHRTTLRNTLNLSWSYDATGRSKEAIEMQEKLLDVSRRVNGPAHPDTVMVMQYLGGAYLVARRTEEALPLRAEVATIKPEYTGLAEQVAVLQLWFGRDEDYAAFSRQVLNTVTNESDLGRIGRIARLASLRPLDAVSSKAVLTHARRAVELGGEHPDAVVHLLARGMAEYRNGLFADAERTLETIEGNKTLSGGTAAFYRSMILFRQGKTTAARALFTMTEANMNPIPADLKNPLSDGADANDLIVWLACKEAKALLANTESDKPVAR